MVTRITIFGTPTAVAGGKPVNLDDAAFLALAILALESPPVPASVLEQHAPGGAALMPGLERLGLVARDRDGWVLAAESDADVMLPAAREVRQQGLDSPNDVIQAFVDACSGELLAGVTVTSPWLDRTRRSWSRQLRSALQRMADRQLEAGDFEGCDRTLARWMAQDRLDDGARRREMQRWAAAGDRERALAAYQAYCDELRDALAQEPGPETKVIADIIREGSGRWR